MRETDNKVKQLESSLKALKAQQQIILKTYRIQTVDPRIDVYKNRVAELRKTTRPS